MAITVTTRASKGSALSFTEMDDNFTDLSISASTTQEGNIEIADQTETDALSSAVLAISPSTLESTVETIIDNGKNYLDSDNGYFWDEGTGYIKMWGITTVAASPTWQAVTLPTISGGTITTIHNVTCNLRSTTGTGAFPGGTAAGPASFISGTTVKIHHESSASQSMFWTLEGTAT